MTLTAEDAIARLKSNETLFNTFVNQATGYYVAADGSHVETIQAFLARNQAAFNAAGNSLTVGGFSPSQSGGANKVIVSDANSNVGLSVTPSAWRSTEKVLQVGMGAGFAGYTDAPYARIYANCYYSAAAQSTYITTGPACFFEVGAGSFSWYRGASGTAGSVMTNALSMTLDANGNLLLGVASGNYHKFSKANASDWIATFTNTSTSNPFGIAIITSAPGGTGNNFFQCQDAGGVRFQILNTGNVQNVNNSYGAISDIKLKENIEDARCYIEDLAQLRVVRYSLKAEASETPTQLGLIAQEVETIFPKLVEETIDRDEEGNDLGTTTKGIKYSVFVPMLITCAQHFKMENDDLKARLTALEARLAALETP